MKRLFEALPAVLFGGACLGLAWLYGAISTERGLFPYPQVRAAYDSARGFVEETFEPSHLHQRVYDFAGVRVHARDRIAPGVVLITSHFPTSDWLAAVELIDADGNVLHSWNADPARLFPGKASRNTYVHGTYVFPNGDLLLNIEYVGMARLDACGTVKWTLDHPSTHHSIMPSADGNFWVSANVLAPEDDVGRAYLKRFQILRPPVFVDHIVKVSPDGEVLTDRDLLDVLYRNGLERYIPKTGRLFTRDILHLNDVEELSPEMANAYPTLEAGDLMVSLRFLHLVVVVDPDDWKVKWHAQEPFISQHDPDFTGDGWIGVFDNNRDTTPRGTLLGGSRILSIRPESSEVRQLYPTADAAPFYTPEGGKWQQLPNGNLLIVEARAGRVFEASPKDGAVLWEWVNERFDEERVPEVLEGTKYEFTPEQIAGWGC
jgi:hypothetical protein